ncbi:DUF3987 domain-containing protein [Aeromonas veronii]|uniref:DUF3987 domain-containing protein n=1 Tax=Aeromonas veronii TaxID=654 RepID=UPI003B9E610A
MTKTHAAVNVEAPRRWSLTQLQQKAANIHANGYALIPCWAKPGEDGATEWLPKPYKDHSVTYTPGEVYANHDRFGVRLDSAILLDYDGNKRSDAVGIFDLWNELRPGEENTPEVVYGEAIQWREVDGAPDGSLHWLFRLPDGFDASGLRQCINDAWPGVDIKTGNQLIYIKADKTLPDDTLLPVSDLLEAPPALLERMKQTAPVRTEFAPTIMAGDTSHYGEKALTSACEDIANAPEGHRNKTLNTQAMKVYQLVAGGVIAEVDADSALDAAALASGQSRSEVAATLHSAKQKGMKEPRKAPELRKNEPARCLPIAANDDGEQEINTASLLDMAGDHPLAVYSREVADSIQISRDSTFMIGLGLTSAMAGAAFCIKTPWGADLPLGLYVTAEQPPAAGKSGVVSAYQKPYREALRRMNEDRNRDLDALEEQISAADDPAVKGELSEQLHHKPQPVRGWISNATPEGLEKDCIAPNYGLFMLASDERGLLNSVFGLSYGKGATVNMDAALKGFDGGSYVSVRTSRRGFDGEVHGSIVCFAQPGSIEAIMEASGGTGLAERFLWLSDEHQLGKRNHLKPWIKPNSEPFRRLCDEVVKLIPARPALDKLTPLAMPVALMDELSKAKQQIEAELGDDGRFGNDAVRGAAGKLDLQVMKIASILHISRHLCEGKPVPPNIGAADFEIALNICCELLERYRQALISKRIIGFGAEADAVIEYLERFPNGKDMEQAKNALRSRAVFKGRGTKPITATIERLAAVFVVAVETGITLRKTIRLL